VQILVIGQKVDRSVDAVKKLAGHILGVHLKDIAAYNDITLKDVRLEQVL
jgi:hypothetical protein